MNAFNYHRRESSVVQVGTVTVGGDSPLRIQSMTNTSTLDTEASIGQCIKIIDAGGDYVRLTAQGQKEAANLKNIKNGLRQAGYDTPLVADIHFYPKAAALAAEIVEKVRINPGNFVDPGRVFKKIEYTDEEYAKEILKIRDKLVPLLNICKQHKTALRIGVNHGSLSDRIMSRYGDTPSGMAESCMEFLRVCAEEKFYDVVVSIKASRPGIMVHTVRLLIRLMEEEKMYFPIHLGVTEAGEGEDGRMKSAVGIGTLLMEGIGDTIRVSLSEDPEKEIPVAKSLVNYVKSKENHVPVDCHLSVPYDLINPSKRETFSIGRIGSEKVPVVICDISRDGTVPGKTDPSPDFYYTGSFLPPLNDLRVNFIVDAARYKEAENIFPLYGEKDLNEIPSTEKMKFLLLTYPRTNERILSFLAGRKDIVVISYSMQVYTVGEHKALISVFMDRGIHCPVIIRQLYDEDKFGNLILKSGADSGVFFIDGLAQGIMISNTNEEMSTEEANACSFGILQATGSRITRTDYISCPSCGRTLFDLQTTAKKVREATSTLRGLKIAVMGCIVNGPGEMADADYGYVGAGLGRVNLYKGKICVQRGIPEENAVESLINLIKSSGDWK